MKKHINMYNDELDDLYVVNGRRVSRSEAKSKRNNPIILDSEDTSKSTRATKKAAKKAMDDITKVPKVRFEKEEHWEKQEIYCIHQGQLVNQGITLCEIGQDPTMCASCPYRKPETIRVKVSSASIKSE